MVEFLTQVRTLAEARTALAAGADHIDVCSVSAAHPGSPDSGMSGLEHLDAIRRLGSACCTVGTRTAEASQSSEAIVSTVAHLAKAGATTVTAVLFDREDRRATLRGLGDLGRRADPAGPRILAMFPADQRYELDLVDSAATAGLAGVILDTADKTAGGLTDLCPLGEIEAFVRRARAAGLAVGLGGALGLDDIDRLVPLGPDLLSFRGALCLGDRDGIVNAVACQAVRRRLDHAVAAVRRRTRTAAEVFTVSQHLASSGSGVLGGVAASATSGDASVEPRDEKPAAGGHPAGPSIRRQRHPFDRIFVRDFELPCRIGVYDEEQGRTQRVRFDVEALVLPSDAHVTDDFRRVFSYDNITDAIRTIVDAGHIGLVETAAERIAARCLGFRQVVRVTVRVEKLERDPGGVGIEITRGRPATTEI